MEWYLTGGLIVAPIVFLILAGVPVAFAFLGVNLIAAFMFMGGGGGLEQVISNATTTLTSFTLAPIPLFVLMGSMFFHAGLANRVFEAIDAVLGAVPGRLCYVTVAGGTAFASLTGSTMANTSMLGSLLVPEMMKRGYSRYMSIGPIIGTGGLATIIPPSTMAVILASVSGLNVGALLVAGLLPGVILALLYIFAIAMQIVFLPGSTPSYDVPTTSFSEKLKLFSVNILPMGFLVFWGVGFIILGVTTPTEAAAFGVLSTGIVAVLFRSLSWSAMKKSLGSTTRITGMALLIILGSSTFSQLLAFSGASAGLVQAASELDLSPYLMLSLMFVTLILLGMLMDPYSILLLTVPLFFPLADQMGFDLVWFALIVLLAMEMSMTTPPFGLLLFLMMGVGPKGTTFGHVVRAALPYLACDLALVIILTFFPSVALYLPSLVG